MRIYPYALPPAADLDPAQLDGRSCTWCGDEDGAMRPVGYLRAVMLFAHDGCAEAHRITEAS